MRRPKASRALRFREDRLASPDVAGVFLAVLGIGMALGALPARAEEPAPARVDGRMTSSPPAQAPAGPSEALLRTSPDARNGVGSGLFFSAKARSPKSPTSTPPTPAEAKTSAQGLAAVEPTPPPPPEASLKPAPGGRRAVGSYLFFKANTPTGSSAKPTAAPARTGSTVASASPPAARPLEAAKGGRTPHPYLIFQPGCNAATVLRRSGQGDVASIPPGRTLIAEKAQGLPTDRPHRVYQPYLIFQPKNKAMSATPLRERMAERSSPPSSLPHTTSPPTRTQVEAPKLATSTRMTRGPAPSTPSPRPSSEALAAKLSIDKGGGSPHAAPPAKRKATRESRFGPRAHPQPRPLGMVRPDLGRRTPPRPSHPQPSNTERVTPRPR